jgi:hypothetical protein
MVRIATLISQKWAIENFRKSLPFSTGAHPDTVSDR